MGYTRAAEMIEFAGFELALRDHLQHNLFPPVSLTFLGAAKQAIAEVEQDEPNATITLPNEQKVHAGEVVQSLHLEAFLDPECVLFG